MLPAPASPVVLVRDTRTVKLATLRRLPLRDDYLGCGWAAPHEAKKWPEVARGDETGEEEGPGARLEARVQDGTPVDRDSPVTPDVYPQPVLFPQLEHV
jgi:hypothetical protein